MGRRIPSGKADVSEEVGLELGMEGGAQQS